MIPLAIEAQLLGLGGFAAGMLISGLADGMVQVIVGRAVQGFGSGAIGSVVYAAIARAYPASATPRMKPAATPPSHTR